MNSQPERLHDRLSGSQLSPDAKIDALVERARKIQEAPELWMDASFVGSLEQRLLTRNAALRLQSSHESRLRQAWLAWSWGKHPLAAVALLCVVLLLVLGTGMLTAAHSAPPNSPLYALKRWESRVAYSLDSPAVAQARLDDQAARDHLALLANVADPAHAGSYRDALNTFNQALATFTQDVPALPAGTSKNQLQQELTALKDDARHRLRGLLPGLALPERHVTTLALANLGESVPRLTSVTVTSAGRGKEQITMSGGGLQQGAQLIIDSKVVDADALLQGGTYVFVLDWSGKQHPDSLGIMNPDGTVALSNQFVWKDVSDTTATHSGDGNHTNGNDNGSGSGNGHGNGDGGKPQATPPAIPTPPAHH